MARGGAQARKKSKKAEVRRPPKHARSRRRARSGEPQMFFPMLRRQAKWVFVLLVIVFGLGFVVFGVGSGSGIGLGDLLGNSSGSSSQVSASEARKKIAANPKDAKAYSDLATALETEGKFGGAIAALRHYTKLVPKNTDALIALGGLYARQGNLLQPKAQAIQAQYREASAGAFFMPPLLTAGTKKSPSAPVTSALIDQTVSNQLQTKLFTLSGAIQKAFTRAEGIYKKLAKANPVVPTVFTLALFAQQAGDTKTTISACKRVVKIAPIGDQSRRICKRVLKTLHSPATQAG